jgi:hypothetical protein
VEQERVLPPHAELVNPLDLSRDRWVLFTSLIATRPIGNASDTGIVYRMTAWPDMGVIQWNQISGVNIWPYVRFQQYVVVTGTYWVTVAVVTFILYLRRILRFIKLLFVLTHIL